VVANVATGNSGLFRRNPWQLLAEPLLKKLVCDLNEQLFSEMYSSQINFVGFYNLGCYRELVSLKDLLELSRSFYGKQFAICFVGFLVKFADFGFARTLVSHSQVTCFHLLQFFKTD